MGNDGEGNFRKVVPREHQLRRVDRGVRNQTSSGVKGVWKKERTFGSVGGTTLRRGWLEAGAAGEKKSDPTIGFGRGRANSNLP